LHLNATLKVPVRPSSRSNRCRFDGSFYGATGIHPFESVGKSSALCKAFHKADDPIDIIRARMMIM